MKIALNLIAGCLLAFASFSLASAAEARGPNILFLLSDDHSYSPVDSSDGQGWKDMQAANAAGKLSAGLRATYFTTPRPVYELYDLDADPSELKNLSGIAEFASAERELREALAEKMILDFDYLPLPALLDDDDTPAKQPKVKRRK